MTLGHINGACLFWETEIHERIEDLSCSLSRGCYPRMKSLKNELRLL